MDNSQTSSGMELKGLRKTAVKSGIYTSLGLIFYFILMRLFNLHQNIQLHYGNLIVLFFGLRYVIKQTKSINGELKYFEGLKAGLTVTIISVIIFDVFMTFYMGVIDEGFLEVLKERISFGTETSDQVAIINIIGLLTMEGLSSGFIITFMLMQYFKNTKTESD